MSDEEVVRFPKLLYDVRVFAFRPMPRLLGAICADDGFCTNCLKCIRTICKGTVCGSCATCVGEDCVDCAAGRRSTTPQKCAFCSDWVRRLDRLLSFDGKRYGEGVFEGSWIVA